jgi:hypothetical protein
VRDNSKKAVPSCEGPYHHFLFLRDGEWAWELEINGADEPNRATILLDSNFKLLAATKNTAPH